MGMLRTLAAPEGSGVSKKNQFLMYKQTPVQGVEFQTSHPGLKRDLKKAFQKYRGRVFSMELMEQITRDMKNFLVKRRVLLPRLTGPFFKTTGQKVVLSYRIGHPYRYGFVFKGNTFFDNHTRLLPKNIYFKLFGDPHFIRKVFLNVTETYLKQGFARVDLSHSIVEDSKGFVRTVYIVLKEGPRMKIKKIHFFGRFSRTPGFYRGVLRKHSGPLFRKSVFHWRDMEEGITNLVNSLKNEGYLKAQAYFKTRLRGGGDRFPGGCGCVSQ